MKIEEQGLVLFKIGISTQDRGVIKIGINIQGCFDPSVHKSEKCVVNLSCKYDDPVQIL